MMIETIKRIKSKGILVIFYLVFMGNAFAQQEKHKTDHHSQHSSQHKKLNHDAHHQKHHSAQSVIEALSPKLRKLLQQEMIAIQQSLSKVIPAVAAADWKTISQTGKAIKNSFILKQQLTDAQVDELHNKLPEEFLKLDQSFHYYAQMLSHAADNQKSELVSFYLAKMTEACSNCHSQFAQHRFPGFKVSKVPSKHHH